MQVYYHRHEVFLFCMYGYVLVMEYFLLRIQNYWLCFPDYTCTLRLSLDGFDKMGACPPYIGT